MGVLHLISHCDQYIFLCVPFCGVTDAPTSAEKAKSDRSGSATKQLRDECFDEPLDMQRQVEEQIEAVAQSEAQQVSVYMSHEDTEVKENGRLLMEVRSRQMLWCSSSSSSV